MEFNGINHPLDVCLKIGDTIGYPIEKSHSIHGLIGDTTFSDKPKDWLVRKKSVTFGMPLPNDY